MAGPPRELDELLRALTRGDPSAISAEELARIEAALEADPALAAALAAEPAGGGDPLVAAVADTTPGPTADEWARVWSNISAGTATAARPAVGRRASVWLRLRVPLAAAAAVLLAIGTWWNWERRGGDAWEIRLAADVEIDDIDMPDSTTPVVIRLRPDGPVVIWALADMSG